LSLVVQQRSRAMVGRWESTMNESLQQVRWVSQLRGRPFLYILLSIPVLPALLTAYLFATLNFPPGVRDWALYGLFPIFGAYGLWMVIILNGPDGSRPPKVEAAAGRLRLSFATRPVGDELALPPEFPLAQASARRLLPRRRGPRNLVYGEVDGRRVRVFDVAYPFITAQGRCETTAVYFPDPVPRLPDWPVDWSIGPGPGTGTGPPEPFASVLAAHSFWIVECRGGRLLIYRLFYLCHPESYPAFLAAAGQVYADIASAANGENVTS
jgi:hypothetical protein